MAELLRTNVAYQVKCSICIAVRVAVETCHTTAWLIGASVTRLVKLLPRKGVSNNRRPSIRFGFKMHASVEL